MRLPLDRRLALSAALLAVVGGVVPATTAYAAPSPFSAETVRTAAPAPDREALTKALKNTLAVGAPGAMVRVTGSGAPLTQAEGSRTRPRARRWTRTRASGSAASPRPSRPSSCSSWWTRAS
ncbi:hypothetical protein GCM10020254_10760 [Streptomyces goshikiensis]